LTFFCCVICHFISNLALVLSEPKLITEIEFDIVSLYHFLFLIFHADGAGDGVGNGAAAAAAGGGVLVEHDWGAGLRDADALVWVGDFNYRVDHPPGFTPHLSDPENSRNDQLYAYVMATVRSSGGRLLVSCCNVFFMACATAPLQALNGQSMSSPPAELDVTNTTEVAT
jgi:hypothetical protein